MCPCDLENPTHSTTHSFTGISGNTDFLCVLKVHIGVFCVALSLKFVSKSVLLFCFFLSLSSCFSFFSCFVCIVFGSFGFLLFYHYCVSFEFVYLLLVFYCVSVSIFVFCFVIIRPLSLVGFVFSFCFHLICFVLIRPFHQCFFYFPVSILILFSLNSSI